jgi:hypothetical protein
MAKLAQFVGDADLAVSGHLQRERDQSLFDLGRDAVLQDRLAPRQFLQRQLAAGVIEFLEAIKAVAAIAHHFAGLADIAQLPGELQKPDFGADDFLVLGHDRCPSQDAEAGRCDTPTISAPGLGSRFG